MKYVRVLTDEGNVYALVTPSLRWMKRYIRGNLLSVNIFFIFFAKKTPWWSSAPPWEKLLVIRAIVWWRVFVLWIWLADTLLHSTAIRYWDSAILQPRGTGLFRSLGVHYSACLRHWHCCFCEAETFFSLQRHIHKRHVSMEYTLKLSQCSPSYAPWKKNCFVTWVKINQVINSSSMVPHDHGEENSRPN